MGNERRFVRTRPAVLITDACIIWHPSQWRTYYETPVNAYCMFRSTFTLPEDPGEGMLRIFADSRYMLWVNGQYVTRGPARSNPGFQYYDTVDIRSCLKRGENTIAFLVVYYGYGTGHSISRIPALFVDGSVRDTAGHVVPVQSHKGWRCCLSDAFVRDSPRVNGCKGSCEIFDNRVYEEGWYLPGYDDSSWAEAVERKVNRVSPFFNLLQRPIPQLEERRISQLGVIASGNFGAGTERAEKDSLFYRQIKRECEQIEVDRHAPCPLPHMFGNRRKEYAYALIDFSQVTAGYLHVDIEGGDGDILDVVFCEELTVQNTPFYDGISNRPVSRWYLKKGMNQLHMFFNYDAMRYAFLIFRGKRGVLHDAWLSSINYPMEEISSFHMQGNQEMKRLWDISVHTLRLCMLDGFLDSPSREQQQWMGDARWQAIYNAYISGDMRMERSLLYQFAQSQDFEGMTASRYPDANINLSPIPTYCLQWINAFRDYYDFTGDLEPVYDLFDHMIRAMRWFTAYEREDGLLWDLPYWSYYGGGRSDQGKAGDYHGNCANGVANLMYLEAVATMRHFAVLLEDAEAEAFYAAREKRLEESIHHRLWSQERGCLMDCVRENRVSVTVSELVNALALLHLYQPGSQEADLILQNIFREERLEQIVHVDVYSMILYIRALLRHGEGTLAWRKTLERYRRMLDSGATSIWEAWELLRYDKDGRLTEMKSACHAWGAAPIVLIAEGLCGISFKEGKMNRGRSQVHIADGFEARMVTPQGVVDIL